MTSVRWGILSTAKIGIEKVIPAMQAGRYCQITGIASRKRDRARAAADELDISKAYGSYEALLGDPEIDAVYNPLPNHLHVPWTIEALKAGKHVLCEKPIGMDADDARTVVEAAQAHPHLRVMEAFMYRFHPQWQRAKQLIDDGEIGDVRTIQSFFSYFNDDPDNIRNQAKLGGGALMDIGCYCVSLSRYLFDDEPQRVWGMAEMDPLFDVDRLTSGMLAFAAGTATFTCSTQIAGHQRVDVLGTDGRIEIEIPFNAPPDRPCRLWHQRGDETSEILTEAANQYTLQGDAFARAILDDTPVPTPLEDAVANMHVIDAVKQSAQSEQWV